MLDVAPLFFVLLHFAGVETYSVPPEMAHLTNFKFKLFFIYFCHVRIAVFDKLEVELIEICFDVYTLKLWIDVLVDKHKVRVDFEAAVFSQD